MKTTILVVAMFLMDFAHAQEFRDQKSISELIPMEQTEDFWVIIENINGDISVNTWDKNEIKVELTIAVRAEFEDELKKGMEELGLKKVRKSNRIILAMEAPFMRENEDEEGNWFFSNCNKDVEYDYNYTFNVTIPEDANLKASTVNNGDVEIRGVQGLIKAGNVNGSIEIGNARNVRYANTVNGSVDVTFDQNPIEDGRYSSINGDITLNLKNDFNARIFSKSMNGDMYSAFDFEYLKSEIRVNTEKQGRGTRYTIGEKSGIEIGKDGPEIKIETLNGNMYLKKI